MYMFLIMGYRYRDSFDRAIVRNFGCFDEESTAYEKLHQNFLDLKHTGCSKSFRNNEGVFWIKEIHVNKMELTEVNVPDAL